MCSLLIFTKLLKLVWTYWDNKLIFPITYFHGMNKIQLRKLQLKIGKIYNKNKPKKESKDKPLQLTQLKY